nr:MAG TPA: hypothetical protein [Caudoviricetes sp.]
MSTNYCFLTVGKTSQSTESTLSKRYIGLASSYIKAVNPDKKTLDSIMGYESQNEPEYVKEDDNGKMALITFIVETDPEKNNDIDLKSRMTFILRNTPAYNRDKTKVQVIDIYGNSTWANVEDAKEGKKLLSASGKELRIASKYRMACVGEADLVSFLKEYLGVGSSFNYINGSWVLKDNADDYLFSLEHVKDYFSGNVSEIKDAIKLQPNNKIKLLFGVRNTDNGQYQTIATRDGLFLRNSAGEKAVARLEKTLEDAKNNGAFSTTEFKVQELQEFSVNPTDLSSKQSSDPLNSVEASDDNPWA